MCGKTTYTCDGTCVTQHNKRKGSASCGALRQVRQHHKVCHKDHDQGLQVVDEHEQMGSMENCSHDFSSILPSEETCDPDQPRTFLGAVSLDGDEIVEIYEPDLVYEQVFDENIPVLFGSTAGRNKGGLGSFEGPRIGARLVLGHAMLMLLRFRVMTRMQLVVQLLRG
jgi:hypothetical protein